MAVSEVPETIVHCPACGVAMDVSALVPFTKVECPACGKQTRVKREFGPYTLVRRHAVGGMSMVFVARDNTLGREVALKILSEEFSKDERRIAAFEEEARITASFSHPNVVRVLRTGRAFERFYIAMEFVSGGHFEHHIHKRGKIPELELLPLAIEVAQGLKAAHAAGLIHRDVKPGNILLDAEGHAKLVDFGLALVTQGGKAQATELWATPCYVPPETVERYEEDFRSDIYALGASLYHALSGRPSCGEETMATDILRAAKKKVIPLSATDPDVSAETCRTIERAMAYDPNDRFGSYDEMIASLAVSLSNLKSGRSESTGSAAIRRAEKKRRERKAVVAGSVVLAIATGVALWWVGLPRPDPMVEIRATPEVDSPPVIVPDTSVDIARTYREARASVAARDFENAAVRFSALANHPAVQEPSRTWAGIEAVMVRFLDGQSGEARRQARETADHMRSLSEGKQGPGEALLEILGRLDALPPMAVPDVPEGGASRVIASMLAGLKNWEQGMIDPAAACFRAVVSAELPPTDGWVSIYQTYAADYLADHELLSGSLFNEDPPDRVGCEAAMDELNAVLAMLKTRGHARSNVRARQLDLARRAKLLETAGPVVPVHSAVPDQPVKLPDVLARLGDFARDCRFQDAVIHLKSLPGDPQGAARSSLLAVAEAAEVFLTDLEHGLANRPVATELRLKSGEITSHIAIDSHGGITATLANGRERPCQWSDFSPDALISLHRVLVKNTKNEAERLRRHECAIAFDWLAGNRERALAAATVLGQSSSTFKQRWDVVASGLPE